LFGERPHMAANRGDVEMPRGDKSAYTDKQKRKAQHIEDGYEKRGLPRDEAAHRARATVNKESGGGNLSGSGRGVPDGKTSPRSGGRSTETRAPMARPQMKRSPKAKQTVRAPRRKSS